MTKRAFLFPGQGSQSIGMLAELAQDFEQVAATFAEASSVLGYDLWKLCQDGPEERLNSTEVTQPAVLTADIAVWRIWRDLQGPVPEFMAGHSLGEYAALVAAGSLQFEDAVALVKTRGRLMQEAVAKDSGGMAAIIGLEDAQVAAVCLQAAAGDIVSPANFNSPGQVVIAGDKTAVERAMEAALEAGARKAVALAVSVPSHCELMRPAAAALQADLEAIRFAAPACTILHNVDAQARTEPAEITKALAEQMYAPVRWCGTIEAMQAQAVTRSAECGPGRVLTGLNRRINRRAEITALSNRKLIENTLEAWS